MGVYVGRVAVIGCSMTGSGRIDLWREWGIIHCVVGGVDRFILAETITKRAIWTIQTAKTVKVDLKKKTRRFKSGVNSLSVVVVENAVSHRLKPLKPEGFLLTTFNNNQQIIGLCSP